MSGNTMPQVAALLAAFRRHDDLRRNAAPLAELAASRHSLYQAEMAAYRVTSTTGR